MKQVADDYLQGMGDLTTEAPESTFQGVQMFSSVTGDVVSDTLLDARYWVENMVSPVRFADALVAMCYKRDDKKTILQLNADSEYSVDTLVEVGPHGALRSAIKETLATQIRGSAVAYLNILDRTTPGTDLILTTAGTLSCLGLPVDIQAANHVPGKKLPKMLVELPPYSFNHTERILHESRLSKNFRLRKHPRHDLFGAPATDWSDTNPRWRHIIRLTELPWLLDHVVTESYVYPGAGYIIMAVEACRQISDPKLKITGFRLKDISIKRALIIPESKDGVETNLSITKMDEASLWPSSVWNRFTDGILGMTRYDVNFHGTLINIHTLHVRCLESGDAHNNGEHAKALCELELAKEINHPFGHDFPRGHQLLKKISSSFTEIADAA